MHAICVLFLSFSHLRLTSVSVVFDFNASLIDVAPSSPMSLSVCFTIMEKSKWFKDVICVNSFCSLFKMSFMSVVFFFSASLSDVAPDSLILLSIC